MHLESYVEIFVPYLFGVKKFLEVSAWHWVLPDRFEFGIPRWTQNGVAYKKKNLVLVANLQQWLDMNLSSFNTLLLMEKKNLFVQFSQYYQ